MMMVGFLGESPESPPFPVSPPGSIVVPGGAMETSPPILAEITPSLLGPGEVPVLAPFLLTYTGTCDM